jgi:hypothetical protein
MKHKEIDVLHPEVIWQGQHHGRLVVDTNSDGYKRIYLLQNHHDGDDCTMTMKRRYGYMYSYVYERYNPEEEFDFKMHSLELKGFVNLEFKTIKKFNL